MKMLRFKFQHNSIINEEFNIFEGRWGEKGGGDGEGRGRGRGKGLQEARGTPLINIKSQLLLVNI